MDKDEARFVVAQQLHSYRELSYAELLRLLDRPDDFEVSGPSGTTYQMQVEALWDDKRGGNLRVRAAIDDGSGWYASFPLADDFILSPDGSFVGE